MDIKKFSLKIIIYIVISLFIMFGFILTSTAMAYKNISPSEVQDLISTATPMIIIDVRTPQEYSQGRIPTSINIPLNILKSEAQKKNIPKTTKIIVYCQRGTRSLEAAKILDDLGYTDVYNLGGIESWPYEIVKR